MPQESDRRPIRYDADGSSVPYGYQGRPTMPQSAGGGTKIVPPKGGSGTAPPKGSNSNQPNK